MGCRSDYMMPTGKERLLQETAILLGYVLEETGQPVPRPVHAASKDIYCRTDFVPDLCTAIRAMDVDTFLRVVYNPYNKESRQLADWWERHEAADRQRQAKEAEDLLKQEFYERVIAKLNDDEIAVLKDVWGIG